MPRNDLTAAIKEAWASANSSVLELHTLEINHPSLTKMRENLDVCVVFDTTTHRAALSTLTKLDIAVLVDTTGSMSGDLASFTALMDDVADALAAVFSDIQYALMSFKDEDDTDIVEDFTSYATFKTALDGLTTSGGGDDPENGFGAIKTACDDLTWRTDPGLVKVVLLLTDTNSHERGASYTETLSALITREASLITNHESENEAGVSFSYMGLIEQTSGSLVSSLNIKKILNAVLAKTIDTTVFTANKAMILSYLNELSAEFDNTRYALVSFDSRGPTLDTGIYFTTEANFEDALDLLNPKSNKASVQKPTYDVLWQTCDVLNWRLSNNAAKLILLCSLSKAVTATYDSDDVNAALNTKKINIRHLHDYTTGYDFDVKIEVTPNGHPDVDLRLECWERAVGAFIGDGDGFVQWESQDGELSLGVEVVGLSVRQAREQGLIGPTADVTIDVGFGWYSPSGGPGTSVDIVVTERNGRTASFTVLAIDIDTQASGVVGTSYTLTIPFDTEEAITLT